MRAKLTIILTLLLVLAGLSQIFNPGGSSSGGSGIPTSSGLGTNNTLKNPILLFGDTGYANATNVWPPWKQIGGNGAHAKWYQMIGSGYYSNFAIITLADKPDPFQPVLYFGDTTAGRWGGMSMQQPSSLDGSTLPRFTVAFGANLDYEYAFHEHDITFVDTPNSVSSRIIKVSSSDGTLTYGSNNAPVSIEASVINLLTNALGTTLTNTGPIKASIFYGDGSALTGISAGGPTTSNSIPTAVTLLSTSASSNCYMVNLNVGTYFPVIATNQWGLIFTNGSHTEGFTVDIFQGTLGNWTGVLLNNTGGSQTNRVGFGTDITAITTTTNSLSWDRFRGIFLAGVAGAPNTTNKIDIVGFVRGYQ